MATNDSVLYIKHLPKSLSLEDREEFLIHFGAQRVRCFSDNTRMKYSAFAVFSDNDTASQALKRLHQLEILGSRLSVEFSNPQLSKYHPSLLDPASNLKTTEDENSEVTKEKEALERRIEVEKKKIVQDIKSIGSKFGLNYPYNPNLQYIYPMPTVNILTNIANALASVPKFYVQVLHLMNKMNLPAPFGHVTPTPPIPGGFPPVPPPPLPAESVIDQPMPPDYSTSEESEIEDDQTTAKSSVKRPRKTQENQPRKKHKLQKIVTLPKLDTPATAPRPEEVFEQPQVSGTKRIELKLPMAIAETLEANKSQDTDNNPHQLIFPSMDTNGEPPKDLLSLVGSESGGFGKIDPVPAPPSEDSSEGEEEWGATEFISSRRLRKGRLSRSEMKHTSVFKSYAPGEATTRLYIKNIARQTTEKDLHYIFGKYVNWEDETEKNMFDIRLMKEGRMKGQAFVTLPNEECAKDALEDTNAFVLHDKPLVVQFARSAKPKEVDPKSKK